MVTDFQSALSTAGLRQTSLWSSPVSEQMIFESSLYLKVCSSVGLGLSVAMKKRSQF